MTGINPAVLFVFFLVASNLFMNLAWYYHLNHFKNQPILIAVLISWGIAFFEYLLQVPGNRFGHEKFSIPQLKIFQEVISLSIFIPVSIYFLGEKPKLGYFLACICMILAVYFVFWFDE
jgi:uncharacterized protein (DUF486 family)